VSVVGVEKREKCLKLMLLYRTILYDDLQLTLRIDSKHNY